jgi:hypothetical protein
MTKHTLLIHVAVRFELEVEADGADEAIEEWHMMPDTDVREAIAKSDYFDIDTFEILNVEGGEA